MKAIPMTIERFFKLLPKTKVLHPRLRGSVICFDRGACPLAAVHKVTTGRGCKNDGGTLRDRFAFRGDSRRGDLDIVGLIMNAADFPNTASRTHTRLRRRMIRVLGLRGKKH